ncbi:MAG: pilin [Microlunatus sp.]|nr:pilin [Microlunatus sp.]
MALPEFIYTANHLLGVIPMQIPNPDPVQPPGTKGVTTLLSWIKWIGFAVAAGAIVVGGILVAVAMRRGDQGQALTNLIWPFAGVIVISGGIGMVSALMGG